MGKNVHFGVFIFIGVLMTVNGFKNIINLEAVPFKSLSYNIGHYCGIFSKAIVGIVILYKGILGMK
jgi:hypothetical protein